MKPLLARPLVLVLLFLTASTLPAAQGVDAPGPVRPVEQALDGVLGEDVPWAHLSDEARQAIRDTVAAAVAPLMQKFEEGGHNATPLLEPLLTEVVPGLYDAIMQLLGDDPDPMQVEQAALEAASIILAAAPGASGPLPGMSANYPGAPECLFSTLANADEPNAPPGVSPAVIEDWVCFAWLTFHFTAAQAINGALRHEVWLDQDGDGMPDDYAKEWEEQAGEIIAWLGDLDLDGLNNLWEFRWDHVPVCVDRTALRILNCKDHEKDPQFGGPGDQWEDGSEVTYWNNPNNDEALAYSLGTEEIDVGDDDPQPESQEDSAAPPVGMSAPTLAIPSFTMSSASGAGGSGGGGAAGSGGNGGGPSGGGGPSPSPSPSPSPPPNPEDFSEQVKLLLQDPDRLLDTDGDGLSNVNDTDSDNDGLLDGIEFTLGTYPEFTDSDCASAAIACTVSTQSSFYDAERQGAPGTGDGLPDAVELAYWNTRGPTAYLGDYDGDGIPALLDPDSDGDGLTDGQEFATGQVRPDLIDTDADSILDGDELQWNSDSDQDGRVNANDQDSDNDGMPDSYEVEKGFVMTDPRDAALDRDADGLHNLGEYLNQTNPDDADTEGDLLLDGEEVITHGTSPHVWDTDADGMADRFEATNSLRPLDASDAGEDADGDFFDQANDGIVEQTWTNLMEYRYGRSTAYNEATSGPWLLGTLPQAPDSDGDGAIDGYEVYWDTNPMLPADGNADEDGDGLNWTDEARLGTDPLDPDTDGDGLCDGSRGLACTFPGLGSRGGQPGEADYATIPFETDTDGDGLQDGQEAGIWDPTATGTGADVDADFLNGLIDTDNDGDGLTDRAELHLHGTDMRLSDTDADQLKDGEELRIHGTGALDADTDSDGLNDGDEVLLHGTLPLVADTDGDSLGDGAELNTHATNPLSTDTDADTLPDAWEVTQGTQAGVADGDVDPDADGLNNVHEHDLGSKPRVADTDGDGMPDGYEDTYALAVTVNDASGNPDGDDLGNLAEMNARANPRKWDTDGDAASDGWELHAAGTDPLQPDWDNDALPDGVERTQWDTITSTAWSGDPDGDGLANLKDFDSDNDGIHDMDEFVSTHTRPDLADTDGDTIADRDEVMTYQGRFDPNKYDTDGDGQSDGIELALDDPNGDADQDNLNNSNEVAYGTDPAKADSDCDGVWDQAELSYWGASWNLGGNRLLNADVDNDGLKDGIEIGAVGTPNQALVRTNPTLTDTDYDGLTDAEEARNNAKVSCNAPMTQSAPAPTSGLTPFVEQLMGAVDAPVFTVDGFQVWRDANGWYLQGGYGVRLYAESLLPTDLVGPWNAADVFGPQTMASPSAGTNGKTTDPWVPDADGDGLSDGQEVKVRGSNPNLCDTDGDSLGDALEAGIPGSTLDPNNACTHLDSDAGTTSNPLVADSDSDGRRDGQEDINRNGRNDAPRFWIGGGFYCGLSGSETNAADGDSDDDGIRDGDELSGIITGKPTQPFCFDTDLDGLSDGLEQGVTSPIPAFMSGTAIIYGTNTGNTVLGSVAWPTWQPWSGSYSPQTGMKVTTNVDDPDSDDDGIPDGLEDVNHNGVFRDYAGVLGTSELDPKNLDSDGDKILDGRELLVYSPTQGNSLQVRFPDLMGQGGFSFSEMVFDPANPWETNPRSSNTDSVEEVNGNSGESVPDGLDLNPRMDAFFAFQFQNFRMTTPPDTGNDKWWIDLYFDQIVVDLPFSNAQFVLSMTEGENVNFYSKNPTQLPTSLINKLDDDNVIDAWPTVFNGAWRARAVASDGALKFNLPDSVPSLDPYDRSIKLTLKAMDSDLGPNPDDRIDLNPIRGQTALSHEIQIASDQNAVKWDNPNSELGSQYLAWQPLSQDYRGINEKGIQNQEDGGMSIKAGDTAPTYFLQGIDMIQRTGLSGLPAGSCAGTANCVR